MAATPNVPQHLKHCNFSTITPRKGVITLYGYGINAQVDRGHLKISDGIGIDRRHARLPRVGHGLRRLVIVGSDGMVSLAALRWLSDQNAAFIMLDRDGSVTTITGPVRPSDARLRRAQSLAHDSGIALKIAKELIRQKLLAQERLIRKQFQNESSIEIIGRARQALSKARSSEEIRRYEAHDRARVIGQNKEALKTGHSMHGEWRVLWPDGNIHWIAGRWQVFMDESGNPVRMIGVNGDITERKLAEEALRESEERLRLATQVARMYAYDWDVKVDVVARSSEHVKILGPIENLGTNHQFVDKIHPDDRPKFLAAIAGLTPENPTGEITYRAQASDGTLVWLKSNGRGFFDTEGKLLRVIGMVADITDVKRAEEALAGMTRKLIEAQEQERARIGRELHDDVCQQLAMLSIELERLQDKPTDEVKSRLRELRGQLNEATSDVQALSHDLHSSKLDYLGAVAGIKSWCKEFAERQGMAIDFNSDVQSAVPYEIGLSLFRVLQEALHNVIKHSGERRVQVQVRQDSNGIQLMVCDCGKGFDLDAALQGKGLGLTSMRERVRLVGGTIAIESKPMGGTTIQVCVPL